jgi:iron-sulfur cluster repair protein YtfE (RIC family)
MKATELLKKQHREVDKLFKESLKTDDADTRRQLMDEINAKLTVHTTIEEEIFYPAVRALGTQKSEDMILEAVEEHHVVKLVLHELPEVDPEAGTFDAKMTVLSELVQHHVEEEQDEMFPMAEKKLGSDMLEDLAQQMQARMRQLGEPAPEPRSRRSA